MKKGTVRNIAVPGNHLTAAELEERIRHLNTVFDVVRVVDPSRQCQIIYRDDGTAAPADDYCFSIWHKASRCANCISAKTLETGRKSSKFEFVDDEIYFMIASYINVDGTPCVLENILHIDDDILLGAYGKNEFVSRITRYNDRIFNDSLTGVRNRRYYDDVVSGLTVQAAAMIDIDHFKGVNDTWHHKAGDIALQTVAKTISALIRKSDILLRYGGDEFLLAFGDIPEAVFARKLESIRAAVEKAVIPGYPQVRLTLSIGGAYGKGQLRAKVEKADTALYRAKKKKNYVCLAGDDL